MIVLTPVIIGTIMLNGKGRRVEVRITIVNIDSDKTTRRRERLFLYFKIIRRMLAAAGIIKQYGVGNNNEIDSITRIAISITIPPL